MINGSETGAMYLALRCVPSIGMSIDQFIAYLLTTGDPELHRIAAKLRDRAFVDTFLFALALMPHLAFTKFEWGSKVGDARCARVAYLT